MLSMAPVCTCSPSLFDSKVAPPPKPSVLSPELAACARVPLQMAGLKGQMQMMDRGLGQASFVSQQSDKRPPVVGSGMPPKLEDGRPQITPSSPDARGLL